MENIIEENAEEIQKIVNKQVDRQIGDFLEKWGLTPDPKKLEEKGYRLIINKKEITQGTTEYTLELCKILDTRKFSITTSIKLN